MKFSAAIVQAIASAADPSRARHGFQQLASGPAEPTLAELTAEHARVVAALFSGSQALSVLLLKYPEWINDILAPDTLAHPRQDQGLRREVNGWLPATLQRRNFAVALSQLRRFKQREMLRIAARDLAGLGETPQIIREISDVADVCLGAVLRICRQQLVERLGQPYHQDAEGRWQPTEFCVLGLGKLGGQELNFSSDVDVIFVYSEEGSVFKEPPRKNTGTGHAITNHQFFKRLAEAFNVEVTRATPEGVLYRIDIRLRPEGDAGPLVRSLASYENFYAQWGQTWERMMLIKARGVAGDAGLAAEFLEMVHPFRYPRSLGEGALREIAAMKTRTENEVIRVGELERDVKRGRGGIREIEFIVQTAQVLNAGRIPFLQGAQTLPLLQKLAQYKLLSEDEAGELGAAYCFLRNVEHRLQMENDLQTHTIPTDLKSRERLAALMGFAKLSGFEAKLKQHTRFVRQAYEKFVKVDNPEMAAPFPKQFKGAEAEWKTILTEYSFRDADKSFRLLDEFSTGPAYAHTSTRTTELARQLIPRILALCRKQSEEPPLLRPSPSIRGRGRRASAAGEARVSLRSPRSERGLQSAGRPDVPEATNISTPLTDQTVLRTKVRAPRFMGKGSPPDYDPKSKTLSDPDRVLARLDSFITAYGARAMLFETWTSNPQLFELLLLLFDRSEFLAEIAIRTPDLVDDLVLSGRLRRQKSADEILRELRHGREDEDQRLWLRRYHQAEFMRIGLRDILGLADYEQNFVELTALADACLQYALEVTARKHKFKTPPLTIIGLGKLGGRELNYGSDLDILFVAEEKAKQRLPRLQKLAAQVMEMLSSQTELGIAFVTDARLRPDGEKGLLVNTLGAYEDYYRHRAQLWEIQALTRTRPIAGDFTLGDQFQQLAGALTNFKKQRRAGVSPAPVTQRPKRGRASETGQAGRLPYVPGYYTPDWKQQIAQMRQRIEKERTPPGQDALAFKTGAGGLIDAEFIAQALCLEHGWQEANTLKALQRIRDEKALPKTDAENLIENYRQLRRIESILRRWSFEGEAVLPVDPAPYYRVSVRCGFATADAFRETVAAYRKAIREVYRLVFPEAESQRK